MLVLGRRIGERIKVHCGETLIEVVPVYLKGRRIGIGIHAPEHVQIMRQEISEDGSDAVVEIGKGR